MAQLAPKPTEDLAPGTTYLQQAKGNSFVYLYPGEGRITITLRRNEGKPIRANVYHGHSQTKLEPNKPVTVEMKDTNPITFEPDKEKGWALEYSFGS